MRILVTWTGNKDPRRCWEWKLAEYLVKRGHDVTLWSPGNPALQVKPDFIIATDAFTAIMARDLGTHFNTPFAVQCIGKLPDPEVDGGYWGKVREAMDQAAVIVAVSESARDHQALTYKPKPPVVVNYQGVDNESADKYMPKRYNFHGNFVWIGTLEKRKQPELAIQAFNKASIDKRIGPLVMVGGITRDYEKCELPPCTRYLGPLKEEDKWKTLAQSKCLVATTYGEEFFIPAAEAAYYGLPLLLPTTSTRPDHWINVLHELWEDAPYWFEPTEEQLLKQILFVAHHPRHARIQGKKAREILLRKNLTMSGHAERWERIILDVLEGSKQPVVKTGFRASVEWSNTGRFSEESFFKVTSDIYAIETELGLPHSGPQPRSLNWSRKFEYPWVVLHSDLHVGEQVLDAGGGDGSLQLFLGRHCFAENLDIEPKLLGMMKQVTEGKNFQLTFKEGTIEKLPYPNASFDKVFCVSVLEHLEPPHLNYVKELLRVVKPGGRLLMSMDVVQDKGGYFKTGLEEAKEIGDYLGCTIPPEPPDILTSTKTEGKQFLDREVKVLCFEILKLEEAMAAPELRLNIGSFTTMHIKPWINLDIIDLTDYAKQNNYNFQKVDVREGLPFENGSVEYINCSHLMEHLTVEQGRRFMLECYRVMKPFGVIRLGVPDGRKIAQAYLDGQLDVIGTGQPEEFQRAQTQAEKLWLLLTTGHSTVYDFTSLQKLFSRAGFVGIQEMKPGKSKVSVVESELRDMWPEHSIYVEAVKPDKESLEELQFGGYRAMIRPYRMDLSIAQEISAAGIYTKHLWEETWAKAGKIVILDIGAHIGFFTLLVAQHASAQIYSFEPHPENFALLERNIALNNLQSRVHAVKMGVAGQKGTRKLWVNQGINTGGHSINQRPVGSTEHIEIECTTLPAILEENKIDRVNIIKLDVEGAEGEILLNTPPEVLAKIDSLVVEFHQFGGFQEVTSYLEKQGFVREHVAGDDVPPAGQGGTNWFVRRDKLTKYKQYLLGMIPEGREAVK